MPQTIYLAPWCQFRNLTLLKLSQASGIPHDTLQSLQNGSLDPPLSLLDSLAEHLHIPTSWLYYHPNNLQRLWNDPEEEDPSLPTSTIFDPLFERIIQVSRDHQEVFLVLTNLLHHGDPKLIRAAQVNLQSLFKQARNTSVPWGSRPPGHFEPPSE